MADDGSNKTSSGVRMHPDVWSKIEAIAREHKETTGDRVTNSRVIELACLALIHKLEAQRGKPYATTKPTKRKGKSPLEKAFGLGITGQSDDK